MNFVGTIIDKYITNEATFIFEMKNNITFLFILCCLYTNGQQKSPFHFSGVMGAGPSLGIIKNQEPNKFRLGQSSGVEFITGFGYLWKEKIDFSIGAGIESYLQNYYLGNFTYDVSYLGLILRADLQLIIPRETKKSDLSIGFGAGINNVGHTTLEHNERDVTVSLYTNKGLRYFFAPHFGLQQELKGNHLTVAATFKRHIAPKPIMEADLTANNASAHYSFHGSYLGVYLKFDYQLNKKDRTTPSINKKEIDKEIIERPSVKEKHLEVKDQYVKIKIWDHSRIDGDIISVKHNGNIILIKHELVRKKKVLHLKLEEGINDLTIMAHNRGLFGENTCAVIVKNGGQKNKFIFNTNEKHHETMELIFNKQ